MKRKFLASYQNTTFDSFNKHTSFNTLIVNLDDIENEKQIPLKIINKIHAYEKEKFDSAFSPDIMLINFWEIE